MNITCTFLYLGEGNRRITPFFTLEMCCGYTNAQEEQSDNDTTSAQHNPPISTLKRYLIDNVAEEFMGTRM